MSDSRTSTRLRMLLLAAGCAAVLGLAACGGDDESSTTTSSTVPAGATGASSTDTGGTEDLGDVDSGDIADIRDAFNQQLMTVLTTTEGLTQSQAQCAIDALEESVSDDDLQAALEEAASTGQPPQDLIDAGFEAGQQCQDQ
jgi:hypothetical protein